MILDFVVAMCLIEIQKSKQLSIPAFSVVNCKAFCFEMFYNNIYKIKLL